MELNHLKYFFAVAKEGGFSKAASALRIAQPAISVVVKRLEDELGEELFERDGRGVRLTKIGNDLFRKCEALFEQVDEIKSVFINNDADVSGSLNIGGAEVIVTHLMPMAIHRLLAKHPKIYPSITTGTASEVVTLLDRGMIEFALLFHSPDLPQDLEIRNVYPIKYKLVIHSSYKDDEKVCSSFIGSREVDNISTKSYPTLKKLRKVYPAASITVSTNSLSAHKELVRLGRGVSILPEYLVKEEIRSGEFACLLEAEDFTFNIKLLMRRGEALSLRAEAFLKEFVSGIIS